MSLGHLGPRRQEWTHAPAVGVLRLWPCIHRAYEASLQHPQDACLNMVSNLLSILESLEEDTCQRGGLDTHSSIGPEWDLFLS